ncbi:hypothetical protein L6Q21_00630 [Sandaracinobacter sp. RS1-74]|uniref:hypothetical protein n=1 Tax=Sandaracinobacteroides sayramensis TaxID=2913411 RepID=UPI001EDB4B27|nr:hypothetical protein [Sandaracinobacteroides sayramensis]MCG2839481.1 hypothetical protein [Sandaracinobacteroides sayramensis]
MRIQFPDLARPKQAAKNLVRMSPDLQLSAAHEALAHVLGYRDWHELSSSPRSNTSTAPFEADDALRVVLGLADALGLPDPDVQYAISKARLLQHWSIDNHLSLRSAIWRQRVFGPPGRGKPGTIVRDKAYGANEPAYLRQAGRPTYLLFDTGMGVRADFEVAVPRIPLADFVPSRLWLPYGYWTLQDGSEVIFARDYLPMWRIAEGTVERLDPWLWINGIAREFHFSQSAATVVWASGPARELALRYLEERRIFELPKLVDVMPHLFEVDVEAIADGVGKLREQRGDGQTPPAYAEINTRISFG